MLPSFPLESGLCQVAFPTWSALFLRWVHEWSFIVECFCFCFIDTRYMRHLLVICCMHFMSSKTSFVGILSIVILDECSWIAPLTPAVMVMRGLTCHPRIPLSVCMSKLYLANIFLYTVVGNISWQYVISMNRRIFGGVGVKGGWLSMGAPSTHRMSSLSLVKHVHREVVHVH